MGSKTIPFRGNNGRLKNSEIGQRLTKRGYVEEGQRITIQGRRREKWYSKTEESSRGFEAMTISN